MMNTQQMIELAKGFQEWMVDNDNERFRLDVIDLADIPQAGFYISQGTTPELGEFIANAPRTILALAEEVARLQARIAEITEYTGAWEDFINSGMPLQEWLDRRP